MKILVAVACCMLVSGCIVTDRPMISGETGAADTGSLDRPRHYTQLLEEAEAEPRTPRTCTMKGTTANCY